MKLFTPKLTLNTLLSQFFRFEHNDTTYRTEIVAGVTTFMTMAYILVVNPRILSNAIFIARPGDLFNQLLVTTSITSAVATALMGILANYPFAVAPALIMVGFLMMSSVQNIDWSDPAQAIAAFLIILTMPLTYSIAEALAIGFIVYPLIKASQGLAHKVNKTVYFLAVISVFHFVLKS